MDEEKLVGGPLEVSGSLAETLVGNTPEVSGSLAETLRAFPRVCLATIMYGVFIVFWEPMLGLCLYGSAGKVAGESSKAMISRATRAKIYTRNHGCSPIC